VACVGDEVKVVSTPPFAESVTEGDVKWNKGETVYFVGQQCDYSTVRCVCLYLSITSEFECCVVTVLGTWGV